MTNYYTDSCDVNKPTADVKQAKNYYQHQMLNTQSFLHKHKHAVSRAKRELLNIAEPGKQPTLHLNSHIQQPVWQFCLTMQEWKEYVSDTTCEIPLESVSASLTAEYHNNFHPRAASHVNNIINKKATCLKGVENDALRHPPDTYLRSRVTLTWCLPFCMRVVVNLWHNGHLL